MYEQIASVLDSSRSYNDRSPSRHSTDSYSPRERDQTQRHIGSAALWMTPASQESAGAAEAFGPQADEEDFSEPTQPTRGEGRRVPTLRKHQLSETSDSLAIADALPPWLNGGRRAWVICADRIWRGRHLQLAIGYTLLSSQVLVAAAIVAQTCHSLQSPKQLDFVWWTMLASLSLVAVQIVAWSCVSLPEFVDFALSKNRNHSYLGFKLIKTIFAELLNLLDIWIYLYGINYLFIFRGTQGLGGVYLMSTGILSAGLMTLGSKYCKSSQVWEHDPNSLYYDLDTVDLHAGESGADRF